MVDFKPSEITYFYKKKQPNCPHKRLLPCVINGWTNIKVFVCSKNDRKCSLKNCKQNGE